MIRTIGATGTVRGGATKKVRYSREKQLPISSGTL